MNFWQRFSFPRLTSLPYRFSIMNTCEERRLGLCLVSRRVCEGVCIQRLSFGEGLQCDVKRSISRTVIAPLRRHVTPTLSESF